ncbi:MAG: 3-hydroxyisobutyrate dehydrogenase [Legionellaceae bacterium]|nr:3-hydroxyisobutyrate dehydrogenase [Legionellaceae bacterium]
MHSIGFIGLGHMGLPMAVNLIKAGYPVTGFDLQPASCQALQQAGGLIGESLAQIAQQSDILITMLQSGAQVKSVTEGAAGLFAHAKANSLYIDCSTIDVDSAQQVHRKAREKQIQALDAPVSGGVAGAKAATLTFMVGGESAVFAQAKAIFSCMGKTQIHAGGAGSGQAAKICNNMILGIAMIAVSEAFLLAKELGLSAGKLHEVVTHASGRCWVMDHYVPVADVLDNVPANDHYLPGFTAAMMLKDLRLSGEGARAAGLHLPMADKARQVYEHFVAAGHSELDFSAVITALDGLKDASA